MTSATCDSALPFPGQPPDAVAATAPSCAMLWCWLLAVLVELVRWTFEGYTAPSFADEGYLWEGMQRVLRGDIPMHDFSGYDPGRYYWCAAFGLFLGNGLVAMRTGVAVFHALGVACGLLAVRRAGGSRIAVIVAAALLGVWSFPSHKLFESSISLMAVFVATWLLESPTLRRSFATGIFVGLAAFFGRNHGLYCSVATAFLLVYSQLRDHAPGFWQRAAAWCAGIIAGYSPMLLLILCVPGFGHSFWLTIEFYLRHKRTNLPLPIPWPWQTSSAALQTLTGWAQLMTGAAFVGLFIGLPVLLAGSLVRGKRSHAAQSLIVGAGLLGVLYAHHASVRAELWHLAQSIHPCLLAMIAATCLYGRPARIKTAVAMVLLLTGSLVATYPRWSTLTFPFREGSTGYTTLRIGSDRLWVPRGLTGYHESLLKVNSLALPAEGLFVAPYEPGLYPLLGRRCPVWNSYLLWPEREARQRQMIQDLESHRVTLAIVGLGNIDNREEYAFENTHSLVWSYLQTHFEPASDVALPQHLVLRRRSFATAPAADPLRR